MMKLLFLFTALILSATTYAEEANDTTFNVKDKKIVVDVQDSKTIVKVYDNNGFQLLKTREMEYVNGQEVEQVYVGSPLIPTENLQPEIPLISADYMVWLQLYGQQNRFY